MRLFAPFLASVIAYVLVVLFLLFDDRQIGPVAQVGVALTITLITCICGFWLVRKNQQIGGVGILIASLCPTAWIAVILVPINLLLKWSSGSYAAVAYLFALLVVAIGVLLVARGVFRRANESG